MLIQRVITALILAPLTLIFLFYSSTQAFCLVTGLVTLAAASEWTHLMEIKTVVGRLAYLALTAIIFFLLYQYILSGTSEFVPAAVIFSCTFLWWLAATLLVVLYPRGSEWWRKNKIVRGIMGIMVLAPCWIALNIIRDENHGTYALLFLFILIWGADSAAYFVGRKWGKHKLAPLVSPGKSREGLYGAMIFSTLIAIIGLWVSDVSFSQWPWAIILFLMTVLFSIVGDLFESMMKRSVGLKDSGKLLPGHGGLLDRIDSLTAAAPVFVLGLMLLGRY